MPSFPTLLKVFFEAMSAAKIKNHSRLSDFSRWAEGRGKGEIWRVGQMDDWTQ